MSFPMTPAERLAATQRDLFWIPEDVRVLRRPGLLAIACARPLPHLNMGLRAEGSPEALREAVGEASAAFAPRSGRWFVPDTVERAPLEAALEEARYRPTHRYEARLRRSTPMPDRGRARAAFALRRVESLAGFRDFVEVTAAAFGLPRSPPDEELEAELPLAAGPEARSRRWVAYEGDRPIAAGGLNLFPELSIGFLWSGGTLAEARGRGAYTALLEVRLATARALGVRWVGLYAREDTAAPIVARHGFEAAGEMTYWAAEGATVPP